MHATLNSPPKQFMGCSYRSTLALNKLSNKQYVSSYTFRGLWAPRFQKERTKTSSADLNSVCFIGLSHRSVSSACLTGLSHQPVSPVYLTGDRYVWPVCFNGLSHWSDRPVCLTGLSHRSVWPVCFIDLSPVYLSGLSHWSVSPACLTGLSDCLAVCPSVRLCVVRWSFEFLDNFGFRPSCLEIA
jgi:hypothetical protein